MEPEALVGERIQRMMGLKRSARLDRNLFRRALRDVPELSRILIRVARGELTVEEAKKLSAPQIRRLKARYRELVLGQDG